MGNCRECIGYDEKETFIDKAGNKFDKCKKKQIIINYTIVGNKISDKFDDLTHPGETRSQRIIRKSKNYVNDVKKEMHETYDNIKGKVFKQ